MKDALGLGAVRARPRGRVRHRAGDGATARSTSARRTIVLAARQPDSLEPVVKELRDVATDRSRGLPVTVEAVAFDATATDTHEAFVEEVFDRFGDFDLVLFAFGVYGNQETADHDRRLTLDMSTANYVGAVSIALPIVDRLRAQGHGSVVVLSSVAGERARRSNYAYGASKAGLDAFFQGLGDALVGSGVSVMIVRPGFVHTKMTQGLDPAPLSTTPEAVAAAIMRGLARGSEIVWVPAQLRWVMSALRHVPRSIFRKLPI